MFAVAGLVLGWLMVDEVMVEDRLRTQLREHGQPVTGVVVQILERSRTDLPLVAEVKLPDGRLAEVSFVSSDEDLELERAEVGKKVQLVVDPRDANLNMLEADFAADWSGVAGELPFRLLFPVLLTGTAGTLAVRAYRLGRPWGGPAEVKNSLKRFVRGLNEPWDTR
ncbi:hypothetical protein EV643_112258 [Kribbella sp. VKM Ac-2527]|uniref:DUF3592 domain-containing protein n=2 Tax=Kribbella caucasensis TaxID=2512215 RepID=A0A4V3C9M2_9ACTN|nr:hypothetical protein EV643_112258 [Kribbella sp. VKM Ac-2527]